MWPTILPFSTYKPGETPIEKSPFGIFPLRAPRALGIITPLSIKDKILQSFPDIKYDDISKAIISSLERKERLNISQLTEQVRKERGSASRRIVRERVDKLIEEGIIQEVETGYGRQLELVPLDKEEE